MKPILIFDLDLDLGNDLDLGYYFKVVLLLRYNYKPLKAHLG